MGDAYVSLSEVFDVRAEGLNADELLSVLLASCEFLITAKNEKTEINSISQKVGNISPANRVQKSGFNGVFSPDTIFLTRHGAIFIKPIPLMDANEEFVPPEMRSNSANGVSFFDNSTTIDDAQLVWCLGEAGARAAQPEMIDASLLSLINLMMLGSSLAANRPTLTKLAQILRNRRKGGPEATRVIIVTLYQELMGDIDELINDEFCDDIRFSSTRSSLSIVSGVLRRRESSDSFATNASVRKRRDELARRMAAAVDYQPLMFDTVEGEEAEEYAVNNNSIGKDDENLKRFDSYKKIVEGTNDIDDDDDDISTVVDESEAQGSIVNFDDHTDANTRFTPLTSPIVSRSGVAVTAQRSPPLISHCEEVTDDGREDFVFLDDSSENFVASDNKDEPKNSFKNIESVKVEVHAPRDNALDEYVTLTNTQNYANAVSARKRSAQQHNARQKVDLENFLHRMDKIEPYESARRETSSRPTSSSLISEPTEQQLQAESDTSKDGGMENFAFEASPCLNERKDISSSPSYSTQHVTKPSPITAKMEKRTSTSDVPFSAKTNNSYASSSVSSGNNAGGFSRQNSLQPSQVQRRQSIRQNLVATNQTYRLPAADNDAVLLSLRRPLLLNFAVPEFLEKSTMPLIRLRAQSMKKKKITLHRQDDALVLVKLLTGQCMEVNCRTDTLVCDIFETVAAHLNVTEHLFFGLALLKNSEYYFLDANRRLEKWAPSGWKSSAAMRHQRANSTTNILAGATLPSVASGANVQRCSSSLATLPHNGSAVDYCLHLRFRYYPRKLEFIKTDATMHSLYLQLRQDILDGVLRFNDASAADVICELAALGLQAEFGAAPSNASANSDTMTAKNTYFKIDNYLPTNFYASNDATTNTSLNDLETRIYACHVALLDLSRVEAERAFIARCQTALGYGAHYYRVSKIKPSSSRHVAYFNRLADVHRLAIMPLGIAICREQTTTGARHVQAAYEWHAIRTLRFDHKRVLISTVERASSLASYSSDLTENYGNGGETCNGTKDTLVVDHVFYTDHYSKSAYLVRFAASQHRFMIKMRHWQSTLNRIKPSKNVVKDAADVTLGRVCRMNSDDMDDRAIDVHDGDVKADESNHEKENVQFSKMGKTIEGLMPQRKSSQSIVEAHMDRYLPSSQKDVNSLSNKMDSNHPNKKDSNTGHVTLPLQQNELSREIDADYLRYCYGSEAQTLRLTLFKHPHTGLGLTLVDGSVNGVRGVYVKFVSDDGDGKRKGLNIGDCLLNINGTSLFNATRHDAVELVKKCGNTVELEILRFPSITEVLESVGTNQSISDSSNNNSGSTKRTQEKDTKNLQRRFSLDRKNSASIAEQQKREASSKQPENLRKYNQRAVSDFGAIGDTLPVLNSDDLIIETLERKKHRKERSSSDVSSTLSPSSSHSLSLSSDEENKTASRDKNKLPVEAQSPYAMRRGKYDLTGAVSLMYNAFHHDNYADEDEHVDSFGVGVDHKSRTRKNEPHPQRHNFTSYADFDDTISWAPSFDATTLRSYKSAKTITKKQHLQKQHPSKSYRKHTLDWTNDLSDIDDGENVSDSASSSPPASRQTVTEILQVEMRRAFAGQPLGFQIGSISSNAVASFLGKTRENGEANGDKNRNGTTFFAVKQITAMPAAGVNLKIDDVILAINGSRLDGCSHERVVELLRAADLRVTLEVERRRHCGEKENEEVEALKRQYKKSTSQETEETIYVMLDKSKSTSIGLSLAKRMGHEGIYIRFIAPNSLADLPSVHINSSSAFSKTETTHLRVGDRIWAIDGECVANESSADIVRRLTQIDGLFEICVKRIITSIH